ncbi:aldo/keto reductase [Paenibacillus odorifer]|jgi:aryl-alcohol dehydrogenase-like predicted oxidoreductase|uniref:aldo/keto reductase n=1 Tax=Paenibacillus TaxID=44249 RepID=UPI0003E2953C|nr:MULTISPECIES: aldo/keto reductase [Paenibacillus]OPG89572.1 aldo/keto reductase [Chryseobacterium mucoviscidosis]ETT54674.1 aldo/keto reductase [Paenibacillus sp. FSL H8-237]OME50703.1 aldo/keto reductase [Paenibacillus odorifer]SIR50036.1 Predicted oxidoreductase [Paenibacillus sp. RU4X]SIR59078.1 Predicted oxidoreductase [Paenibacillus sp. RU4T]
MQQRILGNSNILVSSIGLGIMGMSPGIYGETNDEQSIQTIHRALDIGVTMFDTADVYGNGHNEKLLGRALQGRREQAIIATKFSYTPNYESISGHPDYVKKVVEDSLRRLNTDYIDLYYQHRVDPQIPIEETVGAMADLVKAGKVRALGLSEASASTIRRAHAVYPISVLESEYSLWSRDIEEEILPTVRELGITHVAYSPLSRGFISGELRTFEDLAADDLRRWMPRFQGDNFRKNIEVVDKIKEIAMEKNCTPSQLAIAWTIANGALPIPGTKRIKYLEENAAAADILLMKEDLERIDQVSPKNVVHGTRYMKEQMTLLDG